MENAKGQATSSGLRAAATKATGRGLRGKRIGEAKHPGPQPIKVWSQNVSSWRRHGNDLLELAQKTGVQILICQELNCTKAAWPGISHQARHAGWDFQAVLHVGAGKGGIGIAVRKPLALQVLHNECTEHGQSMMAEVHGCARSIRVAAAYRPPSADFSILEGLLLHLENGPCRPWILGMDGNANMLEGRWPDAMTRVHGVLQAVARHDRSSHPMD